MAGAAGSGHTRWTRLRTIVNWINLSTPLGLLVARASGARVESAGRGIHLATGYPHRFPVASAFTIGSVVLTAHDRDWLCARPALLRHEDRHATQYAWLVGPFMLVLYGLGAAVSWVLAGDHSSYNPLERLADLDDGGYPPPRRRGRGGG